MQCRRTANAGVLLTLDGVTVLLDGVCRQSSGYFGTPDGEKDALIACPPHITAFTHGHLDHFDRAFAQTMYHKTLRSILGPEGLLKEGCICEPMVVEGVKVSPIPSRHIGKAGQEVAHVSYLIEGSKRVLFTGDAAPVQFRGYEVDVLIAPYAYAITSSSWNLAGQIAEDLILLHLPRRECDPDGLWHAVEETVKTPGPRLHIPMISQIVEI